MENNVEEKVDSAATAKPEDDEKNKESQHAKDGGSKR